MAYIPYDSSCPACRGKEKVTPKSDFRSYCKGHLKELVNVLLDENSSMDLRIRNYEKEVVGLRGY